jgi:uncharacterized membrane protein YgdD (TMEM256/DUF423 family)
MQSGSIWIVIGSFNAALAIGAGAFGAHALRSRLDVRSMEIFTTASHYHLIHAVALLAVGITIGQGLRAARYSGIAFALGIALFSGSLYALALSQVKILGAVTPFGGLAFMVGWLWLGVSAIRRR